MALKYPPPSNPETLHKQGDLRVGNTIPARYGADPWIVKKVSLKRITILSRGVVHTEPHGFTSVTPAMKLTYSWDGFGFRRQGSYLRKDGIYK